MFYIIKNKNTNKLITVTGLTELKNKYLDKTEYHIDTIFPYDVNNLFKELYRSVLDQLVYGTYNPSITKKI